MPRGQPTSSIPIAPDPPDQPVELARLDPASDLRSAEIERVVTQRLDLTGRDASGLRLSESRIVDVTLDSVSMSNARFEDIVVTGGSWANSRAAGASFRRVRLDGCV